MAVALSVFFPGKKQSARDKFVEDCLQAFEREIFSNGGYAAPDDPQVGDLEAAARVGQAVEPGVFALRPFRAGGQLVAGPQRVEVQHTFRHRVSPDDSVGTVIGPFGFRLHTRSVRSPGARNHTLLGGNTRYSQMTGPRRPS